MISVVCIFNDEKAAKENLLKSLEGQTAKYQLILVDNTKGQFKSAPEALNYGGNRAKGDYIMFAHQDISLFSIYWLEDVEKMLRDLPDLGIAGCAGVGFSGERRGFIKDRAALYGKPFKSSEAVQVLDECALIIPKNIYNKFKFDKILKGWHRYGADYCLSVARSGLKAYVIPAFVFHNSVMSNLKELFMAEWFIWRKHKKYFQVAWSMTGRLGYRLILRLFIYEVVKFYLPHCIKNILNITYGTFKEWWWKDSIREVEERCKNRNKILALGFIDDMMNNRLIPRRIITSLNSRDFSGQKVSHQYVKFKGVNYLQYHQNEFDLVIVSEKLLDGLNKEDSKRLLEKASDWSKSNILVTSIWD
jgi:hypothetical protein